MRSDGREDQFTPLYARVGPGESFVLERRLDEAVTFGGRVLVHPGSQPHLDTGAFEVIIDGADVHAQACTIEGHPEDGYVLAFEPVRGQHVEIRGRSTADEQVDVACFCNVWVDS